MTSFLISKTISFFYKISNWNCRLNQFHSFFCFPIQKIHKFSLDLKPEPSLLSIRDCFVRIDFKTPWMEQKRMALFIPRCVLPSSFQCKEASEYNVFKWYGGNASGGSSEHTKYPCTIILYDVRFIKNPKWYGLFAVLWIYVYEIYTKKEKTHRKRMRDKERSVCVLPWITVQDGYDNDDDDDDDVA